MSNEHTQHRQCQTCFVHFPTNQELVDHVEEYRFWERILAAERERCRMHIPQSFYVDGRNDEDDNDGDGEDDGRGPVTRPGPLHCPFRGCDRKEPFSTRGNLVRHFQTHILCYEMCPFCQEIFTQVYRFIKHDCKADPDQPKDTYLQHRYTQLNKVVSKELDRLQSLPSTRKRKRGAADSGSIRGRKIVRMIRDSVRPANATLQPHLPVDRSMATDGELACPRDTIKITVPNNADGVLADTAAITTTSNEELTIPAEVTTSMPANGGGWAFAETAANVSANDGGWAFAETAANVPTNDSGWAFAETAATVPENDGGWAFGEAAAILTGNNAELTVPAETTIRSMPANDSGWAFAEISMANNAVFACPGETTAGTANDGEGPFAATMATNGGDWHLTLRE